MQTTTHFNFKKPELTDSPPDITATNTNWDTIDANLKDVKGKADSWNTFKENGGSISGSVDLGTGTLMARRFKSNEVGFARLLTGNEAGLLISSEISNPSMSSNVPDKFDIGASGVRFKTLFGRSLDLLDNDGNCKAKIGRVIGGVTSEAYMRVGNEGQALFGLQKGTDATNGLVIENSGDKKIMRPLEDGTVDLGTSNYKFKDIYANSLRETNGFISNGGDAFVIQASDNKSIMQVITSGDKTVTASTLFYIENGEINFRPVSASNKKINLGTSQYRWKDIYIGDSNTNSNGYTKLPNGLILQWGVVQLNANTNTTTFTLPLAFPKVNLSAQVSILDEGNISTGSACRMVGFNTTTISIANSMANSRRATYLCIGY